MILFPDIIGCEVEFDYMSLIRWDLGKHGIDDGISRVIRYGLSYGKKRDWIRTLPLWSLKYLDLKVATSINSVSIREYPVGRKILTHVDNDWFENPIHVMSLGSASILELDKAKYEIPRRSLYAFNGQIPHAVYGHTATRYAIVYRVRKVGV